MVDKNKDDKIVVRVDANLKEKFTNYVEGKGATVSDYLRQMIVEEITNETVNIDQEIELKKLQCRMKELEILINELISKSANNKDNKR
jgi:antitoxin component of RelBE/YafQ-DinJ toxin-antitoxin module